MAVLDACRPRQDVLAGDLSDTIFAADFGDVIAGTAAASVPRVYGDARVFFENTYPTSQLRKIVQSVFSRLADPHEAGALLRLSTGYGGGKSHTLIALWHLAHNVADLSMGTALLPAAGRPPAVKVLAVDAGKAGFPIFMAHGDVQIRSLWGELAWQLGGEKALRTLGAADDAEAQPDAETFARLLPQQPLLILIDELVIYMATLSERAQANLLAFLSKLASIISRRPQSVLVVTDPAGQAIYAREATRLDQLFDRQMSDIDPIGSETAQVVLHRLFERVDRDAAERVSAVYYNLYQNVARDFPGLIPPRATTQEYARRIVECYPFHPRLIETAQDRLGALQDFQRSRGVLRLFARIVRDVWDRKENLELITAGDIDWTSDRIQADLLQRLNRDNFKAAIAADIEHHAGELDGGARRGIHCRVASALLLESLPMEATSGLNRDELTLAVLRPGEAGPEPGEALDRLVSVCWHTYPMSDGRGWQFRYQPNVLKEIESRFSTIDRSRAVSLVHSFVQQSFAGSAFRLHPWPKSARDVPESTDIQLALCESEELAHHVCMHADDNPQNPQPRRYRHAIVAVAPSQAAYASAIEHAQRLCAAEDIKKDYERSGQIKILGEQINRLIPELTKQMRLHSIRAFNRIVLSSDAAYTLDEQYQVSENEIMQSPRCQAGLRRFLEDKNLMYKPDDALDTHRLLNDVLGGATPIPDLPGVFTARSIYERFLDTPRLRLVPDGAVVRQSILRAVAQGSLVLRLADGTVFDARGAVRGPQGNRRRDDGARPSSFALDTSVLVARSDAPIVASWIATDEPRADEEPVLHDRVIPPPPPVSNVTARSWHQAQEYAVERPLLSLKLSAATPSAGANLLALAQPLGADRLTLTVTVRGQARDGGDIAFQANDLLASHPIKPLDIAQIIFAALGSDRTYEAILSLDFGKGGRMSMADQLARLAASAPPDITPEAVFGKPGGQS